MKQILRIVLKWFVRIILGLAALLVLIVLLFYLFRGKIVERAIDYVNDSQPGVVSLGKLNLRPFMNFPDVALQLKELNYVSGKSDSLGIDSLPVLQLEEIYVSLDAVKLIKGKYKVSNIRLGDGEINYSVGADSISNLEKALGLRFGELPEKDVNDTTILSFDLENIQIRNLILNYTDIPGATSASLKINGLNSGVSYYPDTISANLMVHLDLNSASINEIVLDKSRSISLNASMVYDQISEKVDIAKSALAIDDALFELDGQIDLSQQLVNLSFSAQNRGIDLLNFLLRGVLDTDAIEQIGEGEIKFDGEVSGSYSNNIPEVKMNFSAKEMGFNVNAINQKVTDIGFVGYASNGGAKDFSEAEFRLDNFHMTFPQGAIDANVQFSNLVKPNVSIDINGNADLSVMDEILDTDAVQNMKGTIAFEGAIDGSVDMEAGKFLEDAGGLSISMQNVSFSLPENEIESISGKLFIQENSLGFHDMNVRVDSTNIDLNGTINYLFPYLLGFSADPSASLTFSSREFYYHKLLGDSIYKDPLRDLRFKIGVSTTGIELEKALESGSIPKLNMVLDDLEVKIPGYAEISRVDLNVDLDSDNLSLNNFAGSVGESQLEFRAKLLNYGAYLEKDSAAEVVIEFELGSKVLRARDLLTIQDEFTILPLDFIDEQLEDFIFKGKIETKVQELLKDSVIPNFRFTCDKLGLDLKYYPHSIKDFTFDIEHDDSLMIVNKFIGSVGDNNFLVQASLTHLLDSSKTIRGNLDLQSDLLNITELLNYELLYTNESKEANANEAKDTTANESISKKSADLDQIDFPDVALNLDVAKLVYDEYEFHAINGRVRLKPYHIIYLDRFGLQSENGGSVVLDGLLNVMNPDMYTLSANLEIDTLNVSDFDVQVSMEDSIYSLKENFNGILSADGIAELFINPDLSINLDASTAMFNIFLKNGRVRNFAPLKAVGKYTGRKDLDNVKFGELKNSFTLSNGAIQIPLMTISSTLGLFLIEGEQGLGGDFLYLVRVPVKLIREAAWNVVSNQQRKKPKEEEEVQTLVLQKVAILTVASKEGEVEVNKGDQIKEYQ